MVLVSSTTMESIYAQAANNFLELSSIQRLQILFKLQNRKARPAELVKEFDSTKQEVYRNFARLEDGHLIAKDPDGNYGLTEFGNTMVSQVPSIVFLSRNMHYFHYHNFGDMPKKFKMRIGQIAESQYIKGLGNIFETWKNIYNNAEKYIHIATSELILDLEKELMSRVKNGVKVNYVLSETCTVPKGMTHALTKLGIEKYLQDGLIERRMRKTVQTVIVLNEKEAFVSFPDLEGEPDLAEVFYGDSADFHEWCLDFFRTYWYDAGSYRETKLTEKTN